MRRAQPGRVTCIETRDAPASTAARRTASAAPSTTACSPSKELPNGPKSTSRPDARTASTAAWTCGPGAPSVNGSTVNSMRNTITVHPNAVLLTGGTLVDVDGERRADLRIGRDGRVAEVAAQLAP